MKFHFKYKPRKYESPGDYSERLTKHTNLALILYRCEDHGNLPLNISIQMHKEQYVEIAATFIQIGRKFAYFEQFPNVKFSYLTDAISRIYCNEKLIYRRNDALNEVEKSLIRFQRLISIKELKKLKTIKELKSKHENLYLF